MSNRLENWKSVAFSEKEQHILEAYLDVALKAGVESVTLQKVAKQAKMPYATIHYYFGKSERSLLENALIYVGTASEKFIEQTVANQMFKTQENSVEAYIAAKFLWNEKFPKYASLWCYFIYQTTRDDQYRRLHSVFFKENTVRMRTLLLLEVGKGTYSALRKIDDLSDKIYQTIMGAMFLSMSAAISPKDLKDRKQATLDTVRLLIEKHSK